MHHALGRLDRSGRISVRGLLTELSWKSGDALSVRVKDRAVVLARSATGVHLCRDSGMLVIPSSARNAAGIERGDTVLLSAVQKLDLIIVHSKAAIGAMVLADIRHRLGSP
jgi:bifunctional DNA-binding transcriptional regulator/antitoxin component of YhaV-PrlF toxin-antitoxin module